MLFRSIDGAAGVAQYCDARVNDPAVQALRAKVAVHANAAIGKEQARVRVRLAGGAVHEMFVKHARGSSGRPLDDAELESKFRALAAGTLAPPQLGTVLQKCQSLDNCADVAELASAAAG